jgi:hypothetical protein
MKIRTAEDFRWGLTVRISAELGSAFLCADLEITPEVRDDHAAYIGHWLKALRDDKRLIFTAAAHAQLDDLPRPAAPRACNDDPGPPGRIKGKRRRDARQLALKF